MSALGPKNLRVYRFHPDGLDPVAVYVEEFSQKAGRMTVQCYARAWTAFWGSHDSDGLESFVASVSADYVADSLIWGLNGTIAPRVMNFERKYLLQIVGAIQAEFSKQAGGEA